MFKYIALILALASYVFAKPGLVAPLAYTAPVVAAPVPFVTSSSSQIFARNYNGLAAPLITTPAHFTYPAPHLAYSAPLYAAAAPVFY